jgi:hypothetical protein
MKRKPLRKSKPRHAKATGKSRSRPPARISGSRPDRIDRLVEVSAQALGIPLDPGWREGIAFNLRLILRHAKLVDEFPLADDIEPAPVFYA